MVEGYSVSITRSHFRMLAPQLIDETAMQRCKRSEAVLEYIAQRLMNQNERKRNNAFHQVRA